MENKKYQPLIIPQVSWNQETLTSTYGELVAHPLEPGFGITFGNALRRILLGGIEGSAVTSVIISGVNNEFSSLPGVVEDTMQVILNIKGIVVGNATGQPGRMRLKATGEGVVTAAAIEADDHLTVLNPEHVIAHVAPGGTLEIEFFVESGRGYQPAAWPAGKALQEDNRIYVDAMFSPVRRVTYDVQKTRVGQNIDYDKLILSVTTDGTQSPVAVAHYAVSVIRTQLEHFLASPEISFNEISDTTVKVAAPVVTRDHTATIQGIPADLLLKPIDVLELSVRAHNCLANASINRILDLVNLSEEQILGIKNFGRKSYEEVCEKMRQLGLSFGMNIAQSDVEQLLGDEAHS